MVIFVFDYCGKGARVTWILGVVCWGSFVAVLFSLTCILSAVFAVVFVAGSSLIFWWVFLLLFLDFELFFDAAFVPLVFCYVLCIAFLYCWFEWCCLPLYWIVYDCRRPDFLESIAIVRGCLCVLFF
jgi:hypothetical protein